jgi:cell division septal protein FtsQ
MARQQRQGKASKDEQEDVRPRQPAWKERAPAKPRRRIKHKQATAAALAVRGGGGGKTDRRKLGLPSRETWMLTGRISLLILTAVALTAGLLYLLQMPELTVGRASTQIGVNQRVAPEEIYTSSGIDGRNILLLRAGDVAALVKAIPGVAMATVHVRLPNQVIIDVTEHAPLVAWQAVTSTVWLASDGSAVPQAGAAPPLRFTDQSQGRLDKNAALQKLILDDLGAVHAVQPELSEFYYADEPGLFYVTTEGWQVWLGESGPMDDKLALAAAAAKDITAQGSHPKVIDVRQSERKAMWW